MIYWHLISDIWYWYPQTTSWYDQISWMYVRWDHICLLEKRQVSKGYMRTGLMACRHVYVVSLGGTCTSCRRSFCLIHWHIWKTSMAATFLNRMTDVHSRLWMENRSFVSNLLDGQRCFFGKWYKKLREVPKFCEFYTSWSVSDLSRNKQQKRWSKYAWRVKQSEFVSSTSFSFTCSWLLLSLILFATELFLKEHKEHQGNEHVLIILHALVKVCPTFNCQNILPMLERQPAVAPWLRSCPLQRRVATHSRQNSAWSGGP